MRRLAAGLLAAGLLVTGCGDGASSPSDAQSPPAAPAAAETPRPIEDRVANALRVARDEGTHWHRTDALVRLGEEAAAPLSSMVRDSEHGAETRVLAAQALGRIGGADAAGTLRALMTDEAAPEVLRNAATEALCVLGEREPVERRIASWRKRYAEISIARAGARQRIAKTLYASGQFRAGADAWRALARAEDDPDRRWAYAYDWACCAALAGAKDEALEAVALAVESERTDLDWMARDGDLRTLHDDARFDALLAAAREKRGGIPSETGTATAASSLEGEPGFAEYAALRAEYWDGAFDRHIEENNRYWGGYDDFLEAEGKSRTPEAAAAYMERNGPPPEDPSPEYAKKYRTLLVRYPAGRVGAKLRASLLTIYSNAQNHADWVELYLEAMELPEHESVVGENAGTAMWGSDGVERRDEMRARLRTWLAAHPEGEPAAQIRSALAEDLKGSGDTAAARAAFEEIVRLHPGTRQAKEAKGALYELDTLAVGMPAPGFEAKDIHGGAISLAALRGKVVLLDFWATWCGPCIGELPSLIALHERFEGPDFALVGISLDEDGIALVDFLEEEDMPWPQVCDLGGFEGEVPRLYNVRGIPHTVLVGPDGRILARDLRGDELAAAVEKALAATR